MSFFRPRLPPLSPSPFSCLVRTQQPHLSCSEPCRVDSTPDITTNSTPDSTTDGTPDITTDSTIDCTTDSTPDSTTDSTPDITTEIGRLG